MEKQRVRKVKGKIRKLQGEELIDLLKNNGVLQEANRTFFHPLGLRLQLTTEKEKTKLSIESTDDKRGFILHTVNKFSTKSFNQFRHEKHKERQEKTGFIIQTTDMIRKNKLDTSIVSSSVLKLKALLIEIDNCIYNLKKRIMEVSPKKDDNLEAFDSEQLFYKANEKLVQNKLIDAIAYAMMTDRVDHINKRLKEIRKIKKEQDKIYK
jgi:hypothetical protein